MGAGQDTRRGRDVEAFAASAAQYQRAHLDVNEAKSVRRSAVFEAWGGETEGDAGWTGVPRTRLVQLIRVIASVADLGVVDQRLMSSLMGSWAFSLQFRRPMFALVDAVFKEAPPDGLSTSAYHLFC